MMVSGARKGFWGVPPYERLGGRGVVSVPQMVKGRSLRLIALGVLLCCALALGGIVRTQWADNLLCDALHRLAAGQFRHDLRLPCVSVGIDTPHRRLSGPQLPRSPPKFRRALASARQRYLAPFYTVSGCASDAERPFSADMPALPHRREQYQALHFSA